MPLKQTVMRDDWARRFTEDALARVDAFVAEHPSYSRRDVAQPKQGATNRVIFARCGDGRVVFKVFCEAERKQRECFGLRHWRETGLVPELIRDVDARTIVMSRVPGVDLREAREVDGEAAWRQGCRESGRAVGLLTRVDLPAAERAVFEARFYGGIGTLEAYLGRILELGRSIHARDPDFSGSFWKKSLAFIEGQLDGIFRQRRVLYHQDVGNLHVQQGRFMGFFDLEMCRVGCAAMQLGASLGMLRGDEAGWEAFRAGWEGATGAGLGRDERRAAAAAHHLLHWREISRYLSYDGTPGTGYAWASPADPVARREAIEATEAMLEVER